MRTLTLFDPSLLHYKCWLIFVGTKQKKCFWKIADLIAIDVAQQLLVLKLGFGHRLFFIIFFPQVFTHFLHLENKVLDFPHLLMHQLIFYHLLMNLNKLFWFWVKSFPKWWCETIFEMPKSLTTIKSFWYF